MTVAAVCAYIHTSKHIEYQAEKNFISECNSIVHSLELQNTVSSELLSHMEANHNLLIELKPHQPGVENESERNESFLKSVEGDFRVYVARLSIGDEWHGATIVRDRSDEYARFTRLRIALFGAIPVITGLLSVISWLCSTWAVQPFTEEVRNQNEFLFAVSHELRTPLSVIRMNAENITKAPVKDVGQFVRTILRESKRLDCVTNDLLELTNALRNGWSICLSLQNPGYILLTAYESYELAAQEKKIALRVITPDYLLPQIECDPPRMQQILSVLIENALQYTPAGGQIILQVEQQRRYIAFTVSDSGRGISNDKKSRLFEKFYRGDAAGTNQDHYGLGLYVAMEFVLLHHGELLVEDSPLGGAKFTARIPFSLPR